MSFVICMNDYPVATAETEQKAIEALVYIQRIWDLVGKVDSCQKVYIHAHQVPVVETLEDYHNIFLQKGGNAYQHTLWNLLAMGTMPKVEPTHYIPMLNTEEAAELFENFRKTYPAIDGFIKRFKDHSYIHPILKPRSEGLSTLEVLGCKGYPKGDNQ